MQNKPQWEPDWYLESLLNIHICEMVDRYACLRALRVDLFYQHHTAKYYLQSHHHLERDLRLLMDHMMQIGAVVGYFWVIEWTEDHHYHAHVVFWVDGNRSRNVYPWAEKAREFWTLITEGEGGLHRSEYKNTLQSQYQYPGALQRTRQYRQHPTGVGVYDQNSAETWPAAVRLQRCP